MELYTNKTKEELFSICKDKFVNGRTYEELNIFLDRHKIDDSTRQYIFTELEKVEQELKDNPPEKPKKMKIPLNPTNMVVGIALIALSLTVLLIGNMGKYHYLMALLIAVAGVILIGIEIVKTMVNLPREDQ